MTTMTREQYVRFFGPTTGDRVRLGNTSLTVEVEQDHAEPGEELTTGGGKTFAPVTFRVMVHWIWSSITCW